MKKPDQEFGNDNIDKQRAAFSRALGREADPGNVASVQRATDGPPYSAAETAPADPQRGPLNWAGGMYETSPLTPPAPDHFQNGLTSTPHVDTGLSGVDSIVRGK